MSTVTCLLLAALAADAPPDSSAAAATEPDGNRAAWAAAGRTPPRWQRVQGLADPPTALARMAPLAWGGPLLLGMDLMLPVVVAVPAAAVGALLGAGVFVGVQMSVNPARRPGVGLDELAVGGLGGALLFSTAALLAVDLLCNPLHLSWLAPMRLVGWMVLAVPTGLVLGLAAVALPWRLKEPRHPANQVTGFLLLAVPAYTCLLGPPAALALSLLMRTATEYQRGSPLWERRNGD